MKTNSVLFFASLLIMFLMTGNSGDNINPQNDSGLFQSAEYNLIISRTANNTWRIVNPLDSTTSNISVKAGDTVNWTSDSTNAFFLFSEGKIFGKASYKLSKGGTLSLVVNESAPIGSFTYAVFCTADSQFVTPDSPPRMIILNN